MDTSLRLVPGQKDKVASVADTANSLGLHNTLEFGLRSIAAQTKSSDDLRNRLENWEETQDNLKLTLQRNLYGLHAPMRLLMERQIVSHDPHMPALSASNVHLDILMGRDETISPADVFGGMESDARPASSIHRDMERKLKI